MFADSGMVESGGWGGGEGMVETREWRMVESGGWRGRGGGWLRVEDREGGWGMVESGGWGGRKGEGGWLRVEDREGGWGCGCWTDGEGQKRRK